MHKNVVSVQFISFVCIIIFEIVKSSLLKFDVEPSDKTVPYGHLAVLDCLASSDNVSAEEVSIRWMHGNFQFINNKHKTKDNDSNRFILNNQSLVINVTEDQIYQCFATIPRFGFISSRKAAIKVAELNEFLAEPEDIDVRLDDKVWFSCRPNTTLSLSKISLQWYKDELPLNLDELRMTVLPSGALEIDQIRISDDGWYWCQVSLDNRHLLSSRRGKLTINTDTTESGVHFIAIPRTQTVLEGQDVIFECSANGVSQSDVKWFQDNEPIDMADLDSRFSLFESTNCLVIQNVQEVDKGTYRCQLSDTLYQDANLIIQVPPRFLKKPRDLLKVKNQQVELECEIYADPPAQIHWIHNGKLLEDVQLINGHNLKLESVKESDSGFYQCVVANSVGNIQTSLFLGIIQSDNIINRNSTIWESLSSIQPTNLHKVAVSSNSITLAWTMPDSISNGIVSHDIPRVNFYSIQYKRLDSEREQILNTSKTDMEETIYDLHADKTYVFRVTAWNNLGKSLTSLPLQVTTDKIPDVPSAPQNFNGEVLNSTSIYVLWQPPKILNTSINIYRLYYYDLIGIERSIDTQQTEYILTNLLPYTDYALWVLAVNNNGMGAISKEILLRTFGAQPTDSPQNITLESLSSTTVLIRWEPPPRESRNGIMTHYKIRFRRQRRKGNEIIVSGDKHMIQDLVPGTVYQFRLSAVNINGTGPWSDWYSIETLHSDLDENSIPDMPNPLKVEASSNSITISWSPPLNQTVKIRKYRLGWGKGVPDTYTIDLNEEERSYMIENLDPNSEYVISLRTVNNRGYSPQVYANVYTRDESFIDNANMLLPPMGLRVQVLSPSSVLVSWTDSSFVKISRNSDYRYYVVRYAPMGLNVHRFKYFNTSDLSCVIEDLKPNTQYEFTVKTIKGRRESIWSMVALNTTWEGVPGSSPRDFKVQSIINDPKALQLSWESPKQPNGVITGYNICYMTDESNECLIESVVGDKTNLLIAGLQLDTMYYFKVQAKTKKGTGPFTNELSFRTDKDNEIIILLIPYMIIAVIVVVVLLFSVIILACIFRRISNDNNTDKSGIGDTECDLKKKKNKKHQKHEIKPPDLWIHHDQMELKSLEKNSDGGPSMSGSMTLPRSSTPNDLNRSTNSLDKRTYLPGYSFDDVINSNKNGTLTNHPHYHHHHHHHITKNSKPLVDVTTPVNDCVVVDGLNLHQQIYTRNHYGRVTNANTIGDLDKFQYDPVPSNNAYIPGPSYIQASANSINSEHQSLLNNSNTTATILTNNKKLNSLRSFNSPSSVTPPMPILHTPKSIVGTQVTVRTNTSPYKKPSVSSRLLGSSSSCPVVPPPSSSPSLKYPLPHTVDEIERLHPSTSTEELNQEMANLEGLMKDLNAITASEFQC